MIYPFIISLSTETFNSDHNNNKMEPVRHPYRKSLAHRGFVQGVTLTNSTTHAPWCHYFGGLRYALPPSERWRKAQKLPPSYSYGSEHNPGQCDGMVGVCPQPNFPGLSFGVGWTEDCFQCNIWVPVGEPPQDGWPVLVFIHGGFLQSGTPNSFSAGALLGETAFNAIVVMPAYRLGVFGFLHSSELEHDAATVGEPVGNQGFWDQRLALEWTRDNIALFGGNPTQVTISGYSAGAYSAFYQLSYDLHLPEAQSILKQVCIWSSSPIAQPKSPETAQTQFNQLLSALNIPETLPGPDKLARLRAIPSSNLLSAATSLEANQFRPTTDTLFIHPSLFQSLDNGTIGRRIASRHIRLLLGECRNEAALYATWFPPRNTLFALHKRLLTEYPTPLVDTLISLYCPGGRLPAGCGDWNCDAFGRIYADMQVHHMQRGLVHSLVAGGAAHLLFRYRIEYRLECAEETIPLEWGVTHGTDQYIWFWGNGALVRPDEKRVIQPALIDPWIRFVHGEADLHWGTKSYREMRTLRSDGSVEICPDGLWDEAIRVWKALRAVGEQDK
ncbi:Alpha/Beta hydrolase protein [Aspergillus coremiiformis]|uniref:Carboxylic ester hydrolase n=1 Tax=Aspergillus coremiiformis TaxID=138285 RepID=A0A5N6Z2L1_9EURO|nr:Alpha/Beta hydrolase protein [Aspergillus coremiiformis]